MKKLIYLIVLTLIFSSSFNSSIFASSNMLFSDVGVSHENYEAISYLKDQGILVGYPDGSFRPYGLVNRAEFLKILIEMSGYNFYGSNCYPDVANQWFAPYVCTAKSLGFVNGYDDGYFRPEETINFAEASKMVANSFLLNSSFGGEAWYTSFVKVLENLRAIPRTILSFGQKLTRAEVAEIIWRISTGNKYLDSNSYEGLKMGLFMETSFPIEDVTNDDLSGDAGDEDEFCFFVDGKYICETVSDSSASRGSSSSHGSYDPGDDDDDVVGDDDDDVVGDDDDDDDDDCIEGNCLYFDIGSRDDALPEMDMYFTAEPCDDISGYDCAGTSVWGVMYDRDTAYFGYYELKDGYVDPEGQGRDYEWDLYSDFIDELEPDNSGGEWVTARLVKPRRLGGIVVKGDEFTSLDFASDDLYLTVRYKDTLVNQLTEHTDDGDGASLYLVSNGSKTELGKLGGTFDKKWKTEQFVVPAGSWEKANMGVFFGDPDAPYSNHIMGELPIDKLKLSASDGKSEFEADSNGFWPDVPETNYPNIGRDFKLRADGDPTFIYGAYIEHHFEYYGGFDFWQKLEDTKMNTYVFHNWLDTNDIWYDYYEDVGHLYLGLENQLQYCADNDILVIPNPMKNNDMYTLASHVYGGTTGFLDMFGDVVSTYAENAYLAAWNMIDEIDNEGYDEAGRPLIFSVDNYAMQRNEAPYIPSFVTVMGWMYEPFFEIVDIYNFADIIAIDSYLNGDVQDRLYQQGDKLDSAREVFGDDKLIILVGEGNPSGSFTHDNRYPACVGNEYLCREEVLAQVYGALVHGAKGFLFYKFIDEDLAGESLLEGMTEAGNELFGDSAYPDRIPVSEIVLDASDSVVYGNDDSVYYFHKVLSGGDEYLIAINMDVNDPAEVVFSGLGGIEAEDIFSGDNFTVSSGAFGDNLSSLERKVYKIQ